MSTNPGLGGGHAPAHPAHAARHGRSANRRCPRLVHRAALPQGRRLLWRAGLPTRALQAERRTGREEIEANEAWWPVEYDKVLPFFSPDGSAHACWIGPWGKPFFRCIILPGMASLELDQPSP